MKNSKYNKHSTDTLKGGDYTFTEVLDDKHEPVQAQHLEVKVYNDNFDKAMKAFRALVQKERVLSIYREKQSYEKPSQRKRRKKNEAKRKLLELETDRKRSRE